MEMGDTSERIKRTNWKTEHSFFLKNKALSAASTESWYALLQQANKAIYFSRWLEWRNALLLWLASFKDTNNLTTEKQWQVLQHHLNSILKSTSEDSRWEDAR